MKEKTLPPIKSKKSEYDRLERIILEIFREQIYTPVLKELGENRIQNSADSLLEAIKKGRITYSQGEFKGKFSAKISSDLHALGAKWDPSTRSFRMVEKMLTPDLKFAIAASEDKFKRKMSKIDALLSRDLTKEIRENFKIERFFQQAVYKTDKLVKESLEGITVSPILTKSQADRIAIEYTTNLDKYIKDFSVKEIVELREKIKKNVQDGLRYEGVVKEIQKSYGVSERKATFLARQETNLMMNQFENVRYQDAGVEEYIWTTVAGTKNHPVRESHAKLNGKRFRLSDPPITTMPGEPVRRNNPGEDYNCRCYKRMIVKFSE